MTIPTRWLNAREQQAWRAFLTACQSLFGDIDGQLVRDSGLPHGYYEILVMLSHAPERTRRMSDLAAATQSSAKKKKGATSKKKVKPTAHGQKAPTPDRVREIQDALNRQGVFDGQPTGKWDDATVDAIRAIGKTIAEVNEISSSIAASPS